MSSNAMNFANIRNHNGSQNNGFEELCCQLFPFMIQAKIIKTVRINGAGGDGGVEAKYYLEDGRIIGLQAKYFSTLKTSQWSQIDKSVTAMLRSHPDITDYYVYSPLERNSTQIEKWNTKVTTWQGVGNHSRINFVWVGEFELFNCLIKPEAQYIKSYWFDCPDFSCDWLVEKNQSSITQLHHRYTPKLHQKTRSERMLNLVMSVGKVIDEYKGICSDVFSGWQKTAQSVAHKAKEKNLLSLNNEIEQLQKNMEHLRTELHEGDIRLQSEQLFGALDQLERGVKQLIQEFSALEFETQEQKNSKAKTQAQIQRDFEREFGVYERQSERRDLENDFKPYKKAKSAQFILLSGEAGSGKSHLMACTAENLTQSGHACLLLIGERFTNAHDPKQQITEQLDWDGSFEQLLSCLSSQAEIAGKTAYLMIDALNEASERKLWHAHLGALAQSIAKFQRIKLVVSCRSDLLQAHIPKSLKEQHFAIEHNGFDLNFNEAVQAYFKGYQVKSLHQPTLNHEFKSPLFLKTLCEAYKEKTLPQGSLTFLEVIRAWEQRIAENIEQSTDCPTEATIDTMADIIRKMSESDQSWITQAEAKDICKQHFFNDTKQKGLYYKLLSEGFMCETCSQDSTTQNLTTEVRLQYERFADIRTVEIMLNGIASKAEFLKKWHSSILPRLTDIGFEDEVHLRWDAQPRLFALGLLLPEKIGMELVECPLSPTIHRTAGEEHYMNLFLDDKKTLWDTWLDTLNWRDFQANSDVIKKYFSLWANNLASNEFYSKLFEYACIPKHPLNAYALHKNLNSLTLAERDAYWSVAFAYSTIEEDSEDVVGEFFHWADGGVDLFSVEQVQLALIPLLWLTSSTNRALRNKATDIAIRILYQHPTETCVMGLCERFFEVNDPYVKERLLAVLCGALPACKIEVVAKLGQYVLEHFWSKNPIEPNVMQRDYAEFIVRFACFQGVLAREAIDKVESRPNRPLPDVWTEEHVQKFENTDGYRTIASSLKPGGMGFYGDFGRYVMGSAVYDFVDLEILPEIIDAGKNRHDFHQARADDKKARRYIWQRIVEFGWSPERFAEFEQNLKRFEYGRARAKVERVSKKYQWIGLYEYLGLLADSTFCLDWNNEPSRVTSFSILEQRNYNPSLAISHAISQDDEDGWDNSEISAASNTFKTEQKIILPNVSSDEERAQWVASEFDDIGHFLSSTHGGKTWLCLLGSWSVREAKAFGEGDYSLSAGAKMDQWVHARAMILPAEGHQEVLNKLRTERFFGNGIEVPKNRQAWLSEYPWQASLAEVEDGCAQSSNFWRDGNDAYSSISLLSCEVANVLLPNPAMYRGVQEALGFLSDPAFNSANNTVAILDRNGEPVFISTLGENRCLLVEQESLLRWLAAEKLTFFWCGLSEKMAYDYGKHKHVGGRANHSAIYKLQDNGEIEGGFIDEQYEYTKGNFKTE